MKRFVAPFAVGIAGVLVGLLCWHAYVDHQTIHGIVTFIQQAQQAQQRAAQPPPVAK